MSVRSPAGPLLVMRRSRSSTSARTVGSHLRHAEPRTVPALQREIALRLGSLDTTNRLPEAGMAACVNAVHRYCVIAHAMQADRIDLLATEAVRRADNASELVDAIRERTGREVRIVEGTEEAQLAAQGVAAGFHRPSGIVGDLGGGSLELSSVSEGRVGSEAISLPIGALRVLPLMEEDERAARRHLDEIFATRPWVAMHVDRFFVVGGGWRALARIHLATVEATLRVVHGLELDRDAARALTKSILRTAPDQVAQLPGVPSRRTATVRAAALVLDRLLKAMAPGRIVFSALGLREGWLHRCLPEDQRELDPLLVGAAAFGRPRARVPHIGEAMVHWTAPLFPGETEREQRLRIAVCELSDIGWRDHAELRAQQSFHRLSQFPFVALDHAERVFIALAIHRRYGGNDAGEPGLRRPRPCSIQHPPARRRARLRPATGLPARAASPSCSSMRAWRLPTSAFCCGCRPTRTCPTASRSAAA
ncbi:MAG: Ppx/GppA family phosphatase [Geminicoccaceae bacterium]